MQTNLLARIENKKLTIEDPREQIILDKYNNREVYVVIKNRRKTRTNNQNSYYWGVVLELISQHTGHLPEHMHDYFRFQFLMDRELNFPRPISTKDLNTQDFEEYLSKIRMFASQELGIFIPLPNETTL